MTNDLPAALPLACGLFRTARSLLAEASCSARAMEAIQAMRRLHLRNLKWTVHWVMLDT